MEKSKATSMLMRLGIYALAAFSISGAYAANWTNPSQAFASSKMIIVISQKIYPDLENKNGVQVDHFEVLKQEESAALPTALKLIPASDYVVQNVEEGGDYWVYLSNEGDTWTVHRIAKASEDARLLIGVWNIQRAEASSGAKKLGWDNLILKAIKFSKNSDIQLKYKEAASIQYLRDLMDSKGNFEEKDFEPLGVYQVKNIKDGLKYVFEYRASGCTNWVELKKETNGKITLDHYVNKEELDTTNDAANYVFVPYLQDKWIWTAKTE